MAIERDIHELLYCHDCVIVPHFGGFLTHYRPARLDEVRHLIHPPGKDVSFNRSLVRSDGLLSDHVAHREGIDFLAANVLIDQEVGQWRQRLQRSGRLELSHIGTFYHDGEGNLQFEPDRATNHLRDAVGLRPVAAVPVERKTTSPTTRPVVLPITRPGVQRAPLIWAAAAAALIFTAGAWWAYQLGGEGGPQWSGITLPFAKDPPTYAERSMAIPEFEVLSDLPMTLPDSGTGVHVIDLEPEGYPVLIVDMGTPVTEKTEAVSTAVATREVRSRYHVIGGCFSVEENALRFAADLRSRGFAAEVIDEHKGLHRVAYGSFPQRAAALEALAAVRREEAAQAWLLVK